MSEIFYIVTSSEDESKQTTNIYLLNTSDNYYSKPIVEGMFKYAQEYLLHWAMSR